MTATLNSETDDIIISVRGLQTRFGRSVIHDNLDLDVRRGEIIGIVGGSGAGKSVLLRAIIGLVQPTAGEINVLGENVARLDGDNLKNFSTNWGVLFQRGALFSSLTVAQNVEVPLREHTDMPKALMDEISSYKISMSGLSPDAGDKFPRELSGGMVKRASLARALALDPEILFLDEPTAGLDPIGASEFDSLIARLHDALGLTVFMVTHDLDTLATVCDRIAVLAEKRVIVVGTMDDMLAFDHPWVKEYFHGPRARSAGFAAKKD
ncbi:ABC transporter ATP-binding protein [Govanella unica]|uniref:ABC transporter ATP-binding protein n=1 Tax=Govanella unica TaxID=2975056 RepID=A0A9X3TX73_9PROT|nr:ABC transporter ATP-binding protein [Govania unica]MDA5193436.1 ABC transporter ATP-binding protein [Govania unica]